MNFIIFCRGSDRFEHGLNNFGSPALSCHGCSIKYIQKDISEDLSWQITYVYDSLTSPSSPSLKYLKEVGYVASNYD